MSMPRLEPLELPSTQYMMRLLKQTRRPISRGRSLADFQANPPRVQEEPSDTILKTLQTAEIYSSEEINEAKIETPDTVSNKIA